MEIVVHRINTLKELKKISHKYGVEIDIRTNGSKIILNHKPFKKGDKFVDYIASYRHGTLILNVKESGIEEDILKIKHYNLDVLIRFGFKILRGDILKAAKYGIWSYHHGDNDLNRGGPAGFWEVIEHWDITGSTLQILSEDLDGGKILYKSFSMTDRRSIL